MIENLYVPVVTPFRADGGIDVAALVAFSQWTLGEGAEGVMLFGTTGEGPSISVDEKISVARAVSTALPERAVMASVTEQSIVEATRCVEGYNDLGLAGILVLPPGYFREAQSDGLHRYFETIRRAAASPVVAYHIPNLAPAVAVSMIVELDLWGAKDSGGDMAFTHGVLAAGRSVMVGAERVVADAVAAGASGAIAGMGNLLPATLAAICLAARAGDQSQARTMTESVLGVQAAMLANAPEMEWIAATKQIAGFRSGIDLGDVRLPLVRRRNYLTADVERELARHSLMPA